jgi:hypothetical protein
MALDRRQIKFSEQVDRQVAAGITVMNEGAVLCEVIQNGVAVVTLVPSPSGSEKIAGFSLLPYALPNQAVSNEQFVVPSSGSLIFQLRFSNLVSGSELATYGLGGASLTIDETAFSATPPTGTVKVDIVGGRVKFAPGDAGNTIDFLYRYNQTVNQALLTQGERSINNRFLVNDLGIVGVLKGYLEISTDQYDTTVDWYTGAPLQLGPNGIITIGGAGPVIPSARVLAAPNLSNSQEEAYLRISALIG